jgi:hypothetical protein
MTMYVDAGATFYGRRSLEATVAHRVDGRIVREVNRVPSWVGWIAIGAFILGLTSLVWFLLTGGLVSMLLIALSMLLWWFAVFWTRRNVLGPTEHWTPVG